VVLQGLSWFEAGIRQVDITKRSGTWRKVAQKVLFLKRFLHNAELLFHECFTKKQQSNRAGTQESVGLRKSKRKFGWARTDFVDFAGQ